MKGLNNIAENKENFLKALDACDMVVDRACKMVKLTRTTFYRYLKEDPEFRKAVENIKEQRIDVVEAKMMERIKEGSDKLIEFYLSTKAKHRGYTRQQEIKVSEGKKAIIIKRASDKDDSK